MDTASWVGFLAAVGATSVVSGMVGMMGGMVLLSLMGLWFPPSVVIPLHGCLQAVSNGSRVVMLWREVDWGQAGWFCAGALVGAAGGLVWLPSLPELLLSLLIGAGCLAAVWLPVFFPSRGRPLSARGAGLLGAVTTFLSLVAGSTGPLVDAFLIREDASKARLLGTKATFQTTNHVLKVAVFVAGGWAWQQWSWVVLAAVPLSVLGNRVGQALTGLIPQQPFVWVLRILVTVLAGLVVFAGFQHR